MLSVTASQFFVWQCTSQAWVVSLLDVLTDCPYFWLSRRQNKTQWDSNRPTQPDILLTCLLFCRLKLISIFGKVKIAFGYCNGAHYEIRCHVWWRYEHLKRAMGWLQPTWGMLVLRVHEWYEVWLLSGWTWGHAHQMTSSVWNVRGSVRRLQRNMKRNGYNRIFRTDEEDTYKKKQNWKSKKRNKRLVQLPITNESVKMNED